MYKSSVCATATLALAVALLAFAGPCAALRDLATRCASCLRAKICASHKSLTLFAGMPFSPPSCTVTPSHCLLPVAAPMTLLLAFCPHLMATRPKCSSNRCASVLVCSWKRRLGVRCPHFVRPQPHLTAHRSLQLGCHPQRSQQVQAALLRIV